MAELKSMTQRVERRERNREHAKRSRIRKKFLLESLLEQVSDLRGENRSLRQAIREELPDEAHDLLNACSTEESLLLCVDPSVNVGSAAQQLMEPDFRLMMALQSAQQNFAVSDPSLPDNPIVYASQGFLQLTGYSMSQVIGRNCRFLQGPGTDPKAVDVIREGLREGRDTSVCLLNYKADGTPFWNQFFVASLRDADGNIVNYVGVQCEVNQVPIEEIKERAKRMALLDL
ncbi:PAS domain-containing protein [Pelagophyceae sp. CCMP2097]|nr:PAS domain-containing protein [Pelagophyceae sp. CCMP2097]